jgi:diguanylate cyclase (GGDEF)-like protein
MKIELAIFKNTIAKKLFILFILLAFVPVGLFAYFSIRQVDQVTKDNTLAQLQEDAKGYSYVLNERLLTYEFTMKQFASEIISNRDALKMQTKEIYRNKFKSMALLEEKLSETVYWGKLPDLNTLSSDSLNFLQEGKTLIQIKNDGQTKVVEKLLMLRRVSLDNHPRAILIAELNLNELWGSEDSFDLRKAFCVVNDENDVLFCSESGLQKTLRSMIAQTQLLSRGKLAWSEHNVDIYLGYTSLFLQYNFFQKDWKVVFAQSTVDTSYRQEFDRVFYSIIAITLVIVMYMSLIRIRRQMKPLDALMQGISRLSRNDFTKPVPVLGNDEFGQLAMEFNQMSGRLETQLNVLTTLADIDQLILSRLTINDIIEMALTRANDIIKSDIVSITIISEDNPTQAMMYRVEQQTENKIFEQSYCIDERKWRELSEQRVLQFGQYARHWLDCVQPLIDHEFHYFIIFPIGYKKETSAFITFAFWEKLVLSADKIKWGQEFADRIAVAIDNVSWEKQLYQQAHFDSLTGLPNRLLFYDRLQHAIDQGERDNITLAVLFIDLDGFKFINDSLGHMVGDNLLKKIALRIQECLRKIDTVARIGGDEFVVLMDGYFDPDSFELITILKKILAEISQPLLLEGNELRITASIGVAIYPQDGDSVEALLKNADTALYEAKKLGKARHHFYSKELNATMLKKLLLEADLHKALENSEFRLYYQAQVDTKTGLIVGAEVLLRWMHPELGIISPAVFIPLIEQSGLIIPIGLWVIREACRQNKQWQLQGLPKTRIAINLSTKQFTHKTLYADIKQILAEFQLKADYIEIEITESTAMDDFKKSVAIMNKIHALGIAISIDDYGTGYSSLEYLKDFPVDTLKIDRTFIINLVQSYKEQAIVKSTIAMAHDLGLKVIAEGVEDKSQYTMLQNMGCDQIQGYYFSKPIPAQDFEKLLVQLT